MNSNKNTNILEGIQQYINNFKKNNYTQSVENLSGVKYRFEVLYRRARQGDIDALEITEHMRKNGTDNGINSLGSSSQYFEILTAELCDGIVMDSVKSRFEEGDLEVELKKNKLKKVDILFENGFKLSIKTFKGSNKEINLGAYDPHFSFRDVLAIGDERKQLNTANILDLFLGVSRNGLWKRYTENSIYQINATFDEAVMFIHKGHDTINQYFMEAATLRYILIRAIEMGPEAAARVINRWEGHALRVSRDVFLSRQYSEYLGFHFNKTEGHKVAEFNAAFDVFKEKTKRGTVTAEDFETLQNSRPTHQNTTDYSVLQDTGFDKKIQLRQILGLLNVDDSFSINEEDKPKHNKETMKIMMEFLVENNLTDSFSKMIDQKNKSL